MAHRREECALEQMSSGCWEVYILHYTVKIYPIASNTMYLLSCKKPEGGPPPRCWYTLLKTRGQARGVLRWVNMKTDLFVLNFCIHSIYIYTSLSLHLQATRTRSPCPVGGESGGDGPRSSDQCSHDRYHILGFWALKWSGLGHNAQNFKNSFIRVLYNHK